VCVVTKTVMSTFYFYKTVTLNAQFHRHDASFKFGIVLGSIVLLELYSISHTVSLHQITVSHEPAM
jgi:hypothetical protein